MEQELREQGGAVPPKKKKSTAAATAARMKQIAKAKARKKLIAEKRQRNKQNKQKKAAGVQEPEVAMEVEQPVAAVEEVVKKMQRVVEDVVMETQAAAKPQTAPANFDDKLYCICKTPYDESQWVLCNVWWSVFWTWIWWSFAYFFGRRKIL